MILMHKTFALRAGIAVLCAVSGVAAFARQSPQAELVPPATVTRTGHTVTILSDGRVLLAGGRVERDGKWYWISPAALFDPSVGRLTATGAVVGLRESHQATLLSNGTVLLTGGMGPAADNPDNLVALSSAEIYDPPSGKFKATGAMTRARAGHTAELLPGGRVRITGGEVPAAATPTIEEYDPATGKFTALRAAP
jgi:hypothetical protein